MAQILAIAVEGVVVVGVARDLLDRLIDGVLVGVHHPFGVGLLGARADLAVLDLAKSAAERIKLKLRFGRCELAARRFQVLVHVLGELRPGRQHRRALEAEKACILDHGPVGAGDLLVGIAVETLVGLVDVIVHDMVGGDLAIELPGLFGARASLLQSRGEKAAKFRRIGLDTLIDVRRRRGRLDGGSCALVIIYFCDWCLL